jgi:hypothetical protein
LIKAIGIKVVFSNENLKEEEKCSKNKLTDINNHQKPNLHPNILFIGLTKAKALNLKFLLLKAKNSSII